MIEDVAKAFTPRRIDEFAPRIRRIANDLLDDVVSAERVDLVKSLTVPLPMTVVSELLGVPVERRADFRRWSAQAMGVSPGEHADSMRQLNRYMAELLVQKRTSPTGNLLSALVTVRDEDDGRLSDAELLGTAALLVVAGQDTTTNLLGNAILALLRHPEQARRLRDQPELLPHAVEEFLRYDSPVEHTPFRFAAETVDLAGVTIPRGGIVVVALTSASRDAPAGAQPDELDVARAEPRHLAFGHGIHYCLGAPLARLQAVVVLDVLLRRCPMLRLDPSGGPVRWTPAGIAHGPVSLPVVGLS